MPKLKYKDGSTWKELTLAGSGGTGTALVNITGEPSATVTWTNSKNTDKGSVKLSSSGLGTAYVVTDDTYTFSDSSIGISQKINVDTSYDVDLRDMVGVSIDTTNSNPSTAVTYLMAAVGQTPGWANWKNHSLFTSIKPCVLKDGVVKYYLNPDNFNKKADGTAAKLDGTDGDVMIEFPKMGWKFEKSGTKLNIYLTRKSNVSGFNYYAHSLNSEGDCSKIYIGAYKGMYSDYSNKTLYSCVNSNYSLWEDTIANLRTGATKRGTGYQLKSFYDHLLLQILFLIIYKNLNSQTALGWGYCVNNSSIGGSIRRPGGLEDKGMCASATTSTSDGVTYHPRIKFLGIEDLWGNEPEWLDGCYYYNGELYVNYKDLDSFNYNNWTNKGTVGSGTSFAISKVQGTNALGFLPVYDSSKSGSVTTYYCDSIVFYSYTTGYCKVGTFSGLDDNGEMGIFFLYLHTNTYKTNSGRLVYKKLG